MVMSWWKLAPDEQPPPEIWGLDDALDGWWDEVKAKRKEQYGPTDDSPSEPMQVVDQTQNEHAQWLRKQHGI